MSSSLSGFQAFRLWVSVLGWWGGGGGGGWGWGLLFLAHSDVCFVIAADEFCVFLCAQMGSWLCSCVWEYFCFRSPVECTVPVVDFLPSLHVYHFLCAELPSFLPCSHPALLRKISNNLTHLCLHWWSPLRGCDMTWVRGPLCSSIFNPVDRLGHEADTTNSLRCWLYILGDNFLFE